MIIVIVIVMIMLVTVVVLLYNPRREGSDRHGLQTKLA